MTLNTWPLPADLGELPVDCSESHPMKILVLGGSKFLGRHVVQAALDRGHDVTLFNRGLTDPHRFPNATTLIGDRTCDLDKLAGDRWDVALDTSGHTPLDVSATADGLSGKVAHYTYVSTASVLEQPVARGADESAPVEELPPCESCVVDVNDHNYAAVKAECERIVRDTFDGPSFIVRPGLVVGPEDESDRFTYWLRRIKFGGDILVSRPDQPVQFIDVRDIAEWIVLAAEDGYEGTYLATGPAEPLTMGEFLAQCRKTLDVDGAYFTAVDDSFLLDSGAQPLQDLPLWIPKQQEAFMTLNCQAAFDKRLRTRPLVETIFDTYHWDLSRPWDEPVCAGLTLDQEAELLDAWMARVPAG